MKDNFEKAQIMAAINIFQEWRFALGRKTSKSNLAIAIAIAINALYEKLERMEADNDT